MVYRENHVTYRESGGHGSLNGTSVLKCRPSQLQQLIRDYYMD